MSLKDYERLSDNDLNYLMSQKVMNWSLDPEGCWLWRDRGYTDTEWGDEDNTYHYPTWKPSSDPGSFEVVKDWMRLQGWGWRTDACFVDPVVEFYVCPIIDGEIVAPVKYIHQVEYRAGCIAVLEAVRIYVQER